MKETLVTLTAKCRSVYKSSQFSLNILILPSSEPTAKNPAKNVKKTLLKAPVVFFRPLFIINKQTCNGNAGDTRNFSGTRNYIKIYVKFYIFPRQPIPINIVPNIWISKIVVFLQIFDQFILWYLFMATPFPHRVFLKTVIINSLWPEKQTILCVAFKK